MVDVDVRARSLEPPKYPDARVLRSASNAHHSVSLVGEDQGQFVVAEGSGLTVLAAGAALAAERVRRRFERFAATFAWDRVDAAVRALKTEAGTSFVVAVLAADRLVVFGDPFGSIPLYHTAEGRHVATNPDAVGHAAGAAYDPASFADMMATKRVCFPFTLYEGVRQLSPTACLELSRGGAVVRESGYRPPVLSVPALVESAAVSLERTLADHLDGRRATLAISGGLDSRVLASLSARFAETRSFSITERPSRDATLGALAAEHRGIPHEMFVLKGADFARAASWIARSATSQSSAFHAHFAPLAGRIGGDASVLVTGYGANANFERYDSLEKILARIDAAELDEAVKGELKRRWTAHATYTRETLGIDATYLVGAWPSTQKKAYAFVLTNRHLMPTVDPFMLLPEMFSAKAHVGRQTSNLATTLFRTFCGDETHLPTTRPRHPLGVAVSTDPSAEQADAGWPRKGGMFRLAAASDAHPALAALHPKDTLFFRQMAAVDALWRREADVAAPSVFRRLLDRLRG